MTQANPNHHASGMAVLAAGQDAPGSTGVLPAPGTDDNGGVPATATGPGPNGAEATTRPAPGDGQGGPPGGGWQGRLWGALRRNPLPALLVGALLAVALGAGGAAYTLRQSPSYTSTTVMLIDDPLKLATAGDGGELAKLSGLRVKYAALVSTDAIAAPVARELHVPVGEVLSDVTATVPLQSLLLDVTATAPQASLARQLSSATAQGITYYVKAEDNRFAIPPASRFTLAAVNPTSTASEQARPTARAATVGVVLAVLGFALGFAAVQLVRNRRLLR